MNNQRFTNKVVMVTGASQGIGEACGYLFAREGARVALLARSGDMLAQIAARIAQQGGEALSLPTDLREPAAIQQTFHAVAMQWGTVDILINCAGFVVNVPFIDMDLETWQAILETNLRGVMLCSQAAFRQMLGRGGTIINISSLSGVKNVEKFPGLSAYVASKYGVAGLTEALAVEGKPLNIRVMAISPGAVDTPMLRAAAPHLKPGMQPDDMASIIAFMASEEGYYLNGTNLELYSNG